MLRVIILTLVTVVLFGQGPQAVPVKAPQPDPQRPPIEVDAALRARVSQFYQYEIDRKFYRALQLVAEDTRDYFVESSKAPYLGFQIDTISYSDGFTKAAVVALVSRLVRWRDSWDIPYPRR
jgi:Arc/MetJ family transcription regulator